MKNVYKNIGKMLIKSQELESICLSPKVPYKTAVEIRERKEELDKKITFYRTLIKKVKGD